MVRSGATPNVAEASEFDACAPDDFGGPRGTECEATAEKVAASGAFDMAGVFEGRIQRPEGRTRTSEWRIESPPREATSIN